MFDNIVERIICTFFIIFGLFLVAASVIVYIAVEECVYKDKLYRTAYSDCVAAGNTTYYCYEKLNTNKFTTND